MDWKNPDYGPIFRARLEAAERLKHASDIELQDIKAFYRENIARFISDWGMTYDPRNAERRLPTAIPFVLFDKQIEFVEAVIRKWRDQEPLICEKSRDGGISWLAVGTACSLCLLHEGLAIGFGSRKEEYVDKIGAPKSLFWKARYFMEALPEEFRAGWIGWRDAPHMRINFPDTGSVMMGEAGDQIGRGDRASIYFVDESAHLERPDQVEHSLSQTTNCRIDMSSVKGMNNPFAKKRHEGKIEVFVFDWRDDPRKDQEWYDKQCATLDPVTVAQEIDRDYSASVSGILIPGAWVRSALDALKVLGIAPTGHRGLGYDVADEGTDKNAIAGGTGTQVDFLEEWSGKGSDIFASTQHVFEVAETEGYEDVHYDADGLGADVRGNARVINEQRVARHARQIKFQAFRGSEKVVDPDGIVEGTIGREGDKGRANKDFFQNRKAQGWWSVRRRFMLTHRWITEGIGCAPDDIISIDREGMTKRGMGTLVAKLVTELSQVTYGLNLAGKMLVNKKPDGMKSPNLADGVVIRYAKIGPAPVVFTQGMVAAIQQKANAFGRPRRRYR